MTAARLLAIIPARGGSKGLPGKNIRRLAGLPLIAHSIRLARLCPEIDRAIVSTDSPEIAEVARAHGGDVPFLRPPELARDDTAMWPVVRHALHAIEDAEGRTYDAVVLLDPTTPSRLPEEVAGAWRLLQERGDADGVIGVSRPEFNPLWNCWMVRDGWMRPVFEDSGRYTRRQDVPTVYRINASLYFWRAAFIRAQSATWRSGKMLPYEVSDSRAIHIDDADEFRRAEILIQAGYITLPWLSGTARA
jgi:CMP-N,N'-diacetyllegionaminic acid synthase